MNNPEIVPPDILRLAEAVKVRQPKSYVEAAFKLAHFVIALHLRAREGEAPTLAYQKES